jgi:hypothetical protein
MIKIQNFNEWKRLNESDELDDIDLSGYDFSDLDDGYEEVLDTLGIGPNTKRTLTELNNLDDYAYGTNGVPILDFLKEVNRNYDHISYTIITNGDDFDKTPELKNAIESFILSKKVSDLDPVIDHINSDSELTSEENQYYQGESWLFAKLLTALHSGVVNLTDTIYAIYVDSFSDNDEPEDKWYEFTSELKSAKEAGSIKHLSITDDEMSSAFIVINKH